MSPASRVKLAWGLLVLCFTGWPSTHVLMVVTDPPEASWVFHVLLAISWLALVLTALDILSTSDVRRRQEDDDSAT